MEIAVGCGLAPRPKLLTIPSMNFLLSMLIWTVMAAVIGVGIVMAAKGSVWLLVISLVVFVVMVGKIGCATD